MATTPPLERVDLLQEDDPWRHTSTAPLDASAAAAPAAAADASRAARLASAAPSRGGTSRTYATGERTEAPPMRVIHDNPPSWSGDHPERELEPYLKLLSGWLMTTRTLKSQQGMTIFNHATGDLKLVINELEIHDLCSEDSGTLVSKHIHEAYAEYAEQKLPQSIECGICDKDVSRRRGEGMLQYCIRRDKLFKSLTKEGWDIPQAAKGYILLRDAHLPEKSRDLIEMWSGGNYSYTEMQKLLKKLERPIAGSSGGQRITGMIGFAGCDDEEEYSQGGGAEEHAPIYAQYSEEPQPLTYMKESLYLLPEAFGNDQIDEVWEHWDNPEILFMCGDLNDMEQFSEEEAVAICANYSQVRNYLSPQEGPQQRLLSQHRTSQRRERQATEERRGKTLDQGSPPIFRQERLHPCPQHRSPKNVVQRFPYCPHQVCQMRTGGPLGTHLHQPSRRARQTTANWRQLLLPHGLRG